MDGYQQKALECIMRGDNVFVTGSGGCGKTFLVRHIVQLLEGMRTVAVTSTTGITALNFPGGRTLFSFLGFSIYAQTQTTKYVKRNKAAVDRIRQTDTLIVDEVSMLNDVVFERMDAVLRDVRKRAHEPMGGMQLVLCGDFCQLGPIEGRYCFQSPVWERLQLKTVHLRGQHRQSSDQPFYELLQSVRNGTLSDEQRVMLSTRLVDALPDDVTELCATRAHVDAKNFRRLAALTAEPEVVFRATHKVHKGKVEAKQLFAQMITPEVLTLKRGALVMLTVNLNIEDGLANGLTGEVKEFVLNPATHDPVACIVDFKNYGLKRVGVHRWTFKTDEYESEVNQVPLILAWALTIHKAQGSTLTKVGMYLNGSLFASGMGYVGLSRARSLDSVFLQAPLNVEKAFKTCEQVQQFHASRL